ncbi:MAG: metalloregulator ArsR/SmtB family transcription factor [Chloroflexota bacterium]
MEKTKKRKKEFQTRKAIMDILKMEGAQDSQTLADRLGVTAMAIRQHLYAMQDEKLITFTEVPRPKGRPAKMWGLTPAANKFFPDGNSELLVDMIGLIDNVLGKDALSTIIMQRAEQQFLSYKQQLEGRESLEGKLRALADIRTDEGYMAEVQAKEDGEFWLIENHCPICAAAQSCQTFCFAEQNLFQKLMGPEVSINRIEYILDGQRRCVYKVQEK